MFEHRVLSLSLSFRKRRGERKKEGEWGDKEESENKLQQAFAI